MKTCFISQPISDCEIKDRVRAANFARKTLLEDGWSVFAIDDDKDASYEERVKRDIALMLKADAVYMMKDWHKSKECRLEYRIAQVTGIERIYELNSDKKIYG